MLISFRLAVVSVVSLSCLASAFSTLFVTEGADEGRKMEEMGIKTQKTEGKTAAENQVVVETIPFFTDIFTKAEDVMNLTPLKVATIISAQYLINTVKGIPVAGNQPQDTLNMLSNIFDEFNKTTQIIKLTAEYVNISSHYMLNTLNDFVKLNCEKESVKKIMQNINGFFLDVISKHVKVAIREITQKTEHRELTGTDVLVSSAFHIVAAFQEMTDKVMSLKIDNSVCESKKMPTHENIELTEKNKTGIAFENVKHDVGHKSIKKDHASPYTKQIINEGGPRDSLTVENIDKNPDLTIEIYSRDEEPLVNKEINIPESLKVAFLPETEIESNKNKKNDNEYGLVPSQLGFGSTKSKMVKKNPKNIFEIFTMESSNPKEEINFDIFPPKNKDNSKIQESFMKNNFKNQQKLDSFNVYYYPMKPSNLYQNQLQSVKTSDYLKVPEDLKVNYHPQYIKTVSTPLRTFSIFGNPDSGNKKDGMKEYVSTKSEGSQTSLKNLEGSSAINELNRQDLTVEVFSPEAFMHTGKDESSVDLTAIKDSKNLPKSEFMTANIKNRSPLKNKEHKRLNHKNAKINTLDKELASSAVDSLSNVPSMSYETGVKTSRGRKAKKTKVNAQKSSSTVLMPWSKAIPQFKSGLHHKTETKHGSCGEKVEPVCGIDKHKNNFIIFSNDCQRKHHNEIYKTNYEWANMDACVGFLLRYSSGK